MNGKQLYHACMCAKYPDKYKEAGDQAAQIVDAKWKHTERKKKAQFNQVALILETYAQYFPTLSAAGTPVYSGRFVHNCYQKIFHPASALPFEWLSPTAQEGYDQIGQMLTMEAAQANFFDRLVYIVSKAEEECIEPGETFRMEARPLEDGIRVFMGGRIIDIVDFGGDWVVMHTCSDDPGFDDWDCQCKLCQEHEAWREMPDNPTIVCLCGSTRFAEAFHEANLRETLDMKIVLTIGCDLKSDQDLLLAGELTHKDKVKLDALHFRKIDLAHEVLILNKDGYVGESTRRELEYAQAQGKVIRWLEPEKALLGGETSFEKRGTA
jgi:hypothetical protein